MNKANSSLRIVAISDTHARHKGLSIPPGDILIHAGDMTEMGSLSDVVSFNEFLETLPHPHKIVIAGNHDFCFENRPQEAQALLTNCLYLEDEALEIEGIKFYGSPWQPFFFDFAFQRQRGAEMQEIWNRIPPDTDILITHGPPHGKLDLTNWGVQAGCEELLDAVRQIKPKYHIFGHIHETYGQTSDAQTRFINASVCTLNYQPINPPIFFDYPL